MPYLAPHFDPDVFVSYSHGAPSGGVAPLRDWSRDLVEKLKAGIRALKTEFDGLEVWMDPDIDPTALLTDELKSKAGTCGVLMIVMSERYLQFELVPRRAGMVQSADPAPRRSGRTSLRRQGPAHANEPMAGVPARRAGPRHDRLLVL